MDITDWSVVKGKQLDKIDSSPYCNLLLLKQWKELISHSEVNSQQCLGFISRLILALATLIRTPKCRKYCVKHLPCIQCYVETLQSDVATLLEKDNRIFWYFSQNAMCQPAAPLVDHVSEVLTILSHGDSMHGNVRNLGRDEGGFMKAIRKATADLEVC